MTIKIHRTEKPSTIVCHDKERKQFFMACTRTQGMFSAEDMVERIALNVAELESNLNDEMEFYDLKAVPRQFLKIRSIYHDDKGCDITIQLDHICDNQDEPRYTREYIKSALNHEESVYQGLVLFVSIRVIKTYTASDYFNPFLDEYYDNWRERMYQSDPS